MGPRRKWIGLGACGGLVVLFIVLLASPAISIGGSGCRVVVGSCAPAFSLTDTTGRPTSLQTKAGRPVLLNFWAVDCAACYREEPQLKRAGRVLAAKGLVVLGIDGWAEPAWYIRRYLRQDPFPYPILVDPTQSVPTLYNAWATPQTFFLDRSHRITHRHFGIISYDEIRDQAARVLASRGAAQSTQTCRSSKSSRGNRCN